MPCGSDFKPDLAIFEAALTPRTKVVILNSPNNPSGVVYSAAILKNLAEIVTLRSAAFNTRIYIVSDDSYRKFYYSQGQCPWILNYYPHTIIISSYSKELSIPGERIGYTAVSPLCEDSKIVVGGLIHAKRHPGVFCECPGLDAKCGGQAPTQLPDSPAYRAKRHYLYTHMASIGFRSSNRRAPFSCWYAPPSRMISFVTELSKQHVLTMPGSLYLAAGYIRLSYCVDQPILEGALPLFQKVLSRYHK